MIPTGAVRRIDDLGRLVIPKEVRKAAFGTSDTAGKPMEIFYETDGTIILKPYGFAEHTN
jgi:AbrB family looped-hinge helix DNA binding protein